MITPQVGGASWGVIGLRGLDADQRGVTQANIHAKIACRKLARVCAGQNAELAIFADLWLRRHTTRQRQHKGGS